MWVRCIALLLLSAVILLPGSHPTFPAVDGSRHDPFEAAGHVHVLIFVQSDCPLANRYAPELQRIAAEFKAQPVDFWLVYSDRSAKLADVRQQVKDFQLPGTPLLDPDQQLARRAKATVSPQLAVFDDRNALTYSGRIDDRVVDLGQSRPEAGSHDARDAIAATLDHRPVAHPRTHAVGCFLADVR